MKRWHSKFLLLPAILLAACPLTWAAKGPGSFFRSSNTAEKGNLGVVQKQDLLRQVTVAGTIVPLRRTVVTPQYNSYIKKLFVRLGDRVKAGDPIVMLVQSLKDQGEDTYPMRAPFTGTVVQLMKSEGEFLEVGKEGNAIARVDDLSHLYVNSDVPESDIGKIRVGQEVFIKANAILSRPYHGVIRDIALAAKEKKEWSRSGDRVDFEIKMEIIDKDAQTRPGMSVIVDIITDKRTEVLALAHEYVEKVDGNYFVTLDTGEHRKVEVGLQNEEMFEILRGLKDQDKVRMVDFIGMNTEK